MTLFHLLYYICIFTIVTFHECKYFKHALKEMSLQIRCFIIRLVFYHLASYADGLWIAAEEIMMDIMGVQDDDWVAVTYENNWFPSIVLKVKSINSSHSFLSITLPTYLMRTDPSLKLFRRGEWKICKSFGGGGGTKGVELRLQEDCLTYLSI